MVRRVDRHGVGSLSARWLVLGTLLGAGFTVLGAQAGSTGPRTIVLGVQGRSNATPTMAAQGMFVAVAWGAAVVGGQTDVFTAVSRDGALTFGAPVRVNSAPGDASVNGEQPPAVVLVPRSGRDPAIVVLWTAKGPSGTTLLQARSDDGGGSFAPPTVVPGSDAAGNRGWEAMAVESNGRADALWLDHRELAGDSAMATSHHEHGRTGTPDGVAMAQKSQLFFVTLDGSAVPHPITGGVCYCCKTALAGGANGTIFAAWRHVYPGNLRDIAFTMSRDGGRTFVPPIRVSEDRWVLDGCPDDGPSMVIDAKDRIHLAWPTLEPDKRSEPTIGIFYAMSADGTRFSARVRVPTEGTAHHPRATLAADGTIVIAWDELVAGSRRIAIARAAVNASGLPRFQRDVIAADEPAIYPVLATTSEAVLVAWTSGAVSNGSTIHIARLWRSRG